MITKKILSLALFLLPIAGFSCDSCGCIAASYGGGYSALFDENYIGFRYLYQQYKSKDGIYRNSPYIKDAFHTVQLWAKIPITDRLEILPNIPMQFLTSYKTAGTQSIKGIGDINLNARFKVVDNAYNDWEYSLFAGAGVKIPTGKYDAKNNGSINPGFQLGTGSWDYNIVTEYNLKYKKWGLYQSLSYVMKTANKNHYQFGNQLNYQAIAYRSFGDSIRWVPNIGVGYENYEPHKEYNEKLKNTEGHVWFAKLALNTKIQSIGIGAEYYIPIEQNMLEGKVKAQNRIGFYVNYSF